LPLQRCAKGAGLYGALNTGDNRDRSHFVGWHCSVWFE
jgi:hypothetical protein